MTALIPGVMLSLGQDPSGESNNICTVFTFVFVSVSIACMRAHTCESGSSVFHTMTL